MPRSPRYPRPFTVMIRKPRRRKGSVRRTGVSRRKAAYLAYIKSPAWRTFRAAWWNKYDSTHEVRMCYCCGTPQSLLSRPLELHHRTYERLGRERYDDIVAVCATGGGHSGCHNAITRAYKAQVRTGPVYTLWELTERQRARMRGT